MPSPRLAALALPLLAAACGHGGGAGSSWNATDACKLLPKDKVAAIVGKPVASAELGAVNVSDGANTASVSTCSYAFASGQRLTFMARWSPVDMGDAEVAATRSTLSSMGAATDVPGLGRAAFRNKMQLVVIPDQRRYVSFTSLAPPDGVDLPAAEVAMAKAVIG